MKLDDADLEKSYFPTNPQRIDRSVGYVVVVLVVILIFGLLVSGMNRIQTVSDQTVDHSKSDEQPPAEISDSADPPKN